MRKVDLVPGNVVAYRTSPYTKYVLLSPVPDPFRLRWHIWDMKLGIHIVYPFWGLLREWKIVHRIDDA